MIPETESPVPPEEVPKPVATRSTTLRQARSTPSQEAPFAWQAKVALRAITRAERLANRCHALAVYLVLSMIQSDKETGAVTCTKGYLAGLAGIGPRSVAQALLGLEALGLIQVQRAKLPGTRANAVNAYVLTSCTNCTTSCTGRRTPVHGIRITGKGPRPLP